jgi:hypothetical protein
MLKHARNSPRPLVQKSEHAEKPAGGILVAGSIVPAVAGKSAHVAGPVTPAPHHLTDQSVSVPLLRQIACACTQIIIPGRRARPGSPLNLRANS